MYGIVYFTDFSSLSLTVYKQQLQIVQFWAKLARSWYYYGAILCCTVYSCQNKRQNALFWATKLKKFLGRAPSLLGGGHPLPKPHLLVPAALRPIFANPQLFFHNSHTVFVFVITMQEPKLQQESACTPG